MRTFWLLCATILISSCSVALIPPRAANPVISVSYAAPPDVAPVTVTLSTKTAGATIYYTLDTSPPFPPPYGASSLAYGGPFVIPPNVPFGVQGDTVKDAPSVANVSSIAGLASGNEVSSVAFPSGTTLVSISGTAPYTLTLSTTALATWTAVTLTFPQVLLYGMADVSALAAAPGLESSDIVSQWIGVEP